MRRFHYVPVIALALAAIFSLVAPVSWAAEADDQLARELAVARAEACVLTAKATGYQPCATIECKAAEVIASKLVDDAVSQVAPAPVVKPPVVRPPAPAAKKGYAVISADGQTLTYADGKVYRRMPSGAFMPQDSSTATAAPATGGCYTDPVTGRTVCPYQRR